MKDNKLTPEEIKKALECCKPYTDEGCLKCPLANVFLPECAEILYKETLDLINRQQAEIERLQNSGIRASSVEDWLDYCNGLKSEAIKEFAEKLKDLSYESDLYDRNERWVKAVTVEEIDETYKEMGLE